MTYTNVVDGSWDTEDAFLSFDGIEVLRDTFKHSDFSVGDVCASGWGEQFVEVKIEFDHFSEGLTI